LFVFFHLGAHLDAPDFAAEARLHQRIWHEARINLTPGSNFHCMQPGWFRLCFAHPQAVLDEALLRLDRALTR
jgi:1-aminocyclopropane-1-carboxylate synthase